MSAPSAKDVERAGLALEPTIAHGHGLIIDAVAQALAAERERAAKRVNDMDWPPDIAHGEVVRIIRAGDAP